MYRSNAEATIYTERDGDAFAPGTSRARDHPDAAITLRPPAQRRRSRFRSATASRRSSLRRLGTESLHDSSLEERVSCELVSEAPAGRSSRQPRGWGPQEKGLTGIFGRYKKG